ncbi:MAG: ribonuclease R [Gammaproteobacteria bacterium]
MVKHIKINSDDPHASREANNYEHPIPSREFILKEIEKAGVPVNMNRLINILEISNRRDIESLRRRIRAMERDGQIMRNRRGAYCLLNKMDLEQGVVSAHKDGFGFLIPDQGDKDLFLSAKEMRAVLHGDRVIARIIGEDRRGRLEGAIVEIVERKTTRIVGRYIHSSTGVGFVTPDNKRFTQNIIVPEEQLYGAVDGQIVVVEMLEFPSKFRQAVGRVIEILGEHLDEGLEIDVAIRSHGLRQEWSQMVEIETENLTAFVPESAIKGRNDLRNTPLVTIDGEDARDFDDAVFCETTKSGWRLLVAIADVSSYVKPGTGLDAEARERGTSVYFPERVIPMLPEILSNGLCSLNPDVDRLCMVCEMNISSNGEMTNYKFYQAVMRSHCRFTYTDVAAILVDNDDKLIQQHQNLVPHLKSLYDLYKVLRVSRQSRGAIDFETTETKIQFGDNRKIEKIVPVYRNEAHCLIEECMLAANVAAAGFLNNNKIPTLYRNHKGPGKDKLNDVRSFLKELGLELSGGLDPEPADYAKLLASIAGRVDQRLIQTVMLRSLSQAVYDSKNIGHFGLAFESYAHFTSPIRRYPDLMVHRAITHLVDGKQPEKFYMNEKQVHELGVHCSAAERKADEASWDVIDWLKCEFMQDHVDEEFTGIITGVTGFGLFVELEDIFVEGLVHVTALGNDYYQFDAVHHRMIGEHSNRIFRLADKVQIRVVRVNLDERQIDFELADKDELPDNRARIKDKKKSKKPKSKRHKTRKRK